MKMFIAARWRDGMKIAAGYGIEKLCFGPSQKAMTLKLLFCRNMFYRHQNLCLPLQKAT